MLSGTIAKNWMIRGWFPRHVTSRYSFSNERTWFSYSSNSPSTNDFHSDYCFNRMANLFCILYWNATIYEIEIIFREMWAIFSSHGLFSFRPPNFSIINALNALRIDPIVIAFKNPRSFALFLLRIGKI